MKVSWKKSIRTLFAKVSTGGRTMRTVILALFLLPGCSVFIDKIAGDFEKDPVVMLNDLKPKTKKFLDQAFEGINPKCLRDVHVHAVGNGSGGTGNWVNPDMMSLSHPYKFLQYKVYLSASGLEDLEDADEKYMQRLIKLARSDRRYGKMHLLAFDKNHTEEGVEDLKRSTFYITNEHVWNMYEKYPDIIVPTISVHPYRKDAIQRLEKWAKKGARYIKWLPNAQRIDPASDKLDEYYKVVKKYNMVILSHTGEEKAVDGEEFQELANPLRFRRPLDMGVKIIMAHAASLGQCKDLEQGGKKSCFDLFWRVLSDKKYENNLWGELSGITIHTRVGAPTETLLDNPQVHHRLVNGSDYPLPAINILYRTTQFKKLGYITNEEKEMLNEIYDYNPLIFDFVLKRNLKHPKTGKRFSPSAFELPPELCELN